MKYYDQEKLDPKQMTSWNPVGANDYITETAGFVPLEVKFKRFEQAGIAAQFDSNEFTSSDYREMYLNPDFQISPEDDMEEAFEKMKAQRDFINQLAEKKRVNAQSAADADDIKTKKEVSKETDKSNEQMSSED